MMAWPSPSKPSKAFPRANLTEDGWSTEDEATATCFCGAVQLVFVRFLTRTPVPCETPNCLFPPRGLFLH